jgi:N-acetyl-gamma-glutamyl-phosphate reductase
MIRAAILGATGYTALELLRILIRHPEVRVTALTTRQDGNPPISAIHPSLTGLIDVRCENLSAEQVGGCCVLCPASHSKYGSSS